MAKNIWDEIKDYLTPESKQEEERRKKTEQAVKESRELEDELAKLEKEYTDSLPKEEAPDLEALFPSDSGLREKAYTPPTDSEIVQAAADEVRERKIDETDKVEDKYRKQQDSLDKDRRKAEDTLSSAFDKLKALFEDYSEDAKSSAVENGTSRGSIISSQIDALERQRDEGEAQARRDFLASSEEISSELRRLEAERSKALDELNIKYASELNDRIEELKAQRQKDIEQTEKYNANIRKQQAEYDRKREESVAEYLDELEKKKEQERAKQEQYEQKYGYSGEKQENYLKRYELAYDFYTSLSPEIAADALKASPNMQHYLGYYYDKLLQILLRRAS